MNKINNPNAIGGVLLFCLLLGWVGYMSFQKFQLRYYKRFTIGITLQNRPTLKGRVIDYYYLVNGVRYENSRHADTNPILEKDGRYYVEFLPSDPTVNDILWSKQVPEHIKKVPPEGWKKIPQ